MRSEWFRRVSDRPPGVSRSDFDAERAGRPPGAVPFPPVTASANLAELLARAAAEAPDRPAFVHGPTRWTYADAAHRASRLADGLASHGVAPGDVVAWIGDNTPAAALAYFGAAWAGAVLAPLHLRLTDADLRRVLGHAGAKVVLVEAAHRARAAGWGLPLLDLGTWAGSDGGPSGPARGSARGRMPCRPPGPSGGRNRRPDRTSRPGAPD